MKYSLTLNQKAVYDCGMEKDIDFSDLAILTVIKHISSISNVQVISEGEKLYYWISYTHIASELPLLGLKKDSVYRRVKKYVDLGLIIPHKSNQNNHKSYYSFTEFFDLLFTDHQPPPRRSLSLGPGKVVQHEQLAAKRTPEIKNG